MKERFKKELVLEAIVEFYKNNPRQVDKVEHRKKIKDINYKFQKNKAINKSEALLILRYLKKYRKRIVFAINTKGMTNVSEDFRIILGFTMSDINLSFINNSLQEGISKIEKNIEYERFFTKEELFKKEDY